jgi:hypothetical protein
MPYEGVAYEKGGERGREIERSGRSKLLRKVFNVHSTPKLRIELSIPCFNFERELRDCDKSLKFSLLLHLFFIMILYRNVCKQRIQKYI